MRLRKEGSGCGCLPGRRGEDRGRGFGAGECQGAAGGEPEARLVEHFEVVWVCAAGRELEAVEALRECELREESEGWLERDVVQHRMSGHHRSTLSNRRLGIVNRGEGSQSPQYARQPGTEACTASLGNPGILPEVTRRPYNRVPKGLQDRNEESYMLNSCALFSPVAICLTIPDVGLLELAATLLLTFQVLTQVLAHYWHSHANTVDSNYE